MRMRRSQRGFLLMAAVVLIAVAAVMAAVIVTFTAGSGLAGGIHVQSTQAFFAAESGLERAIYGLTKGGVSCSAPLAFSGTVGQTAYATTSTNYSATSALPSAITDTQAYIPIAAASLASYAPFGQVTIGSEKINYAKTSTSAADCGGGTSCLAQAQRGAGGTTAAAHIVGASVVQNQCNISSIGTGDNATRNTQAVVQTSGAVAALGAPVSPGAVSSTVPSVTWAYTVAAGSNRLLIVTAAYRDDANNITASATYAGLAMTSAIRRNNVSSGDGVTVQIFYLVNPTVGTANAVVNFRLISSGAATSTRTIVGAAAFSGIDQATPIEASNSAGGSSNAPSVTVTTVSANAWVVDAIAREGGSTFTMNAATNRVQAWNAQTGNGSPHVGGASSYRGPIASAGAVAQGWSWGTTNGWAAAAIALKPSTGGAGAAQTVYWRDYLP